MHFKNGHVVREGGRLLPASEAGGMGTNAYASGKPWMILPRGAEAAGRGAGFQEIEAFSRMLIPAAMGMEQRPGCLFMQLNA